MNPREHREQVQAGPSNAETATPDPRADVAVDRMVTLMGGVELSVILMCEDGAPRGENVKILQLPIRQFPALRRAMGDEVAQAAIYCGRPVEWAERLTPASHESVIVEGKRINADFFCRWVARQKENDGFVARQDPQELALIMEAMARANPKFVDELLKRVAAPAPGR